ncbi:MAG: transcriptional repressor [Clostridiales bacterium]|nr:transcriptional repressor [Clostridiales bacterium]MCF8021845.1 transcriptional repressor [Clostridiales bacterium]
MFNDLEKKLVQEGYKITKNRRVILEVFNETPESWITAQDLFEKVLNKNQKINFSTVYRNLNMLTKIGILYQVNKEQGLGYYRLNNNQSYHHHLICKSCGKTWRVQFCPLKELGVEHIQGFTIVDHKFEIYGYCSDCKKQGKID